LFDAETNTRIRLGRSSLSYRETYDDVSGVLVQYVCNGRDAKARISVDHPERLRSRRFEETENRP